MYGFSLIGLARCIAMVIVWNDLQSAIPKYPADWWISIPFPGFCFSGFRLVFIDILPGWLGNG
jgi:ACR3 family arsenite transporter